MASLSAIALEAVAENASVGDSQVATQVLHEGINCDACGMCPIRGPRYSHKGRSWDLCESDFRKLMQLMPEDKPKFKALHEAIEDRVVSQVTGKIEFPSNRVICSDPCHSHFDKIDDISLATNKVVAYNLLPGDWYYTFNSVRAKTPLGDGEVCGMLGIYHVDHPLVPEMLMESLDLSHAKEPTRTHIQVIDSGKYGFFNASSYHAADVHWDTFVEKHWMPAGDEDNVDGRGTEQGDDGDMQGDTAARAKDKQDLLAVVVESGFGDGSYVLNVYTTGEREDEQLNAAFVVFVTEEIERETNAELGTILAHTDGCPLKGCGKDAMLQPRSNSLCRSFACACIT